MKSKLLFLLIAATALTQVAFSDEQGDDNPTGVAGIFNGQITTAGSYDPFTGNAMRSVDDIVVPGSLGAYPLKWSRFFNSHATYQDNFVGGGWRFSYLGYQILQGKAYTPDGREFQVNSQHWGVEDYYDSPYPYTTSTLHLADGGQVSFTNSTNGSGYPTQITDPYGVTTTITSAVMGGATVTKITEPGGRYLQ